MHHASTNRNAGDEVPSISGAHGKEVLVTQPYNSPPDLVYKENCTFF
jgi:hypothetical protein